MSQYSLKTLSVRKANKRESEIEKPDIKHFDRIYLNSINLFKNKKSQKQLVKV